MSEGINRVTLLGNLGADPELRMTHGGQAVLNIRLATGEVFFDANKVKQERTEWHRVVIWGKRAEALAKYLVKGERILVEGRIAAKEHQKADGSKWYQTDIIATNIVLCGGARGGVERRCEPSAEVDEYASLDNDQVPF